MRWQAIAICGITFIGCNSLIIWGVYEYFLRIMPRWEAIIPITDDDTEGAKIRNKYGRYLVSDTTNQSWWEWSRRYISKSKSDKGQGFKDISIGYSDTDEKALNKQCGKLYDKETLNDQEKKDIWRYCSIGRVELITLDKVNKYTNINEDEKKRLVSTEHKTNNWWWAIRAMEFVLPTKKILEYCEHKYNNYSNLNDKEKLEVLEDCGLPV